jgi:WD40 repeat protein
LDGVRFWDVRAGRLVAFKPTREAQFVAFHPSDNSLLAGGRDGVERWPIAISSAGGLVQPEIGPAQVIDAATKLGWHDIIGVDRTAETLAVVSSDKVYLLDSKSNYEKHLLFSEKPVAFAAVSANARWCAAANPESGRLPTGLVHVVDTATHKVLRTLPAKGVTAVAFSPDDKWLAIGGFQEYWLLDTRSWQCADPVHRDRATDLPAVLALSPDSRLLAIAWSARAIQLIEPSTSRQVATLESPEPGIINALAFSPDGTQLAVGRRDHIIALWDLRLIRKELASMKLDWDLPPYP